MPTIQLARHCADMPPQMLHRRHLHCLHTRDTHTSTHIETPLRFPSSSSQDEMGVGRSFTEEFDTRAATTRTTNTRVCFVPSFLRSFVPSFLRRSLNDEGAFAEGTKERRNEGKKERWNERTNERTNEQANERRRTNDAKKSKSQIMK